VRRPPPMTPLFPYTTLFRSGVVARTDLDLLARGELREHGGEDRGLGEAGAGLRGHRTSLPDPASRIAPVPSGRASSTCRRPLPRSEEHTSELQSRENIVCRL